MEVPEGQKNAGSNGSTALAKLLNQLNIPTLLAVMFFGGGNFFVTKEDGRLTREEQVRVVGQVRDLHDALGEFEQRQKDTVAKVTQTLENQAQELRNQRQMLDSQTQMLAQLHRWEQNFKNPEP